MDHKVECIKEELKNDKEWSCACCICNKEGENE
jgi:hypothetical protein